MATLPVLLAALAGAVTGLDDASGLVQYRLPFFARFAVAAAGAFNCTAHPELCQEPFNCQDFRGTEPAQWNASGVGRVDFKTWCTWPQYGPYIGKCVAERDPVGAGQLQFKLTEAGMFDYSSEQEGNYCFIEGHCANEDVNASTTWEQTVPLCDKRFGRKRWTAHRAWFSTGEDMIGGVPLPRKPQDSFTSRKQTTGFVIAACAMGSFHCDVMYCKSTYCKSPYFQAKYGHLLKKEGWVKQ
mmetsp:Transcript_36710/g.105790  ORF Transcript_36710/g.105790 Transcript_36710/m.105790 type:complete len:241 (-) Transcript_36710:249-971(-)